MKKSVLLPIIFFFPILFSTIAYCNQLTIVGNPSGVTVDYFRGDAWAYTNAGEFAIQLAGFESAAYCVELGTGSGSGDIFLTDPSDYSNFSGFFTGNYNGLYAAWLMDQYSTGLGFTGYNVNKNIADAALQIAIWSTLYNYDHATNSFNRPYDPNNPNLGQYFDNDNYNETSDELSAWGLAEVYKTALIAVSSDGFTNKDFSGKYRFFVAESVEKQNLLVAQAIPEPATMALFGFGLLGLSALGRKKE